MPPTTQSMMSIPGPVRAPGGSKVTAMKAPRGSASPDKVALQAARRGFRTEFLEKIC